MCRLIRFLSNSTSNLLLLSPTGIPSFFHPATWRLLPSLCTVAPCSCNDWSKLYGARFFICLLRKVCHLIRRRSNLEEETNSAANIPIRLRTDVVHAWVFASRILCVRVILWPQHAFSILKLLLLGLCCKESN